MKNKCINTKLNGLNSCLNVLLYWVFFPHTNESTDPLTIKCSDILHIIWSNERAWHNWVRKSEWVFILITPFTEINYRLTQSRIPGTRAGFLSRLGFFICIKFAKQWPCEQRCLSLFLTLSHRWPSEIWAPSRCVVAKSN